MSRSSVHAAVTGTVCAPDYALHSLGWNGFQHLCGTILREVWGQTFQVFADGNDAGRDGAFYGSWRKRDGGSLSGNTVVQCKFSSLRDRSISLADLRDERGKVVRLAQRGLVRHYVLMTNQGLTGAADEQIRHDFESVPGVETCSCYARDWICSTIAERQRLRMLVPRLYGLGDLSQILDERAYAQARAIIRSMDDELGKFVVTKAHQDSVHALNRHRFVLLLGAPASGKSTIASALALGAADQWGSQLVKLDAPEQFRDHWNVHEPRQFFWVDDAFGQTQYERPRALAWNHSFPALLAAVKAGAAVVFTSRDYVYRAALDDLKEEAFPLLREAQVVIQVQKLSVQEREQILYNHIKLGRQRAAYRRALKPLLPGVARSEHFLPEIARRLGDPFFTRDLPIEVSAVMDFVERPQHFLCDVIRRLDPSSRAALGIVFMRGGRIPSLRKLGPEENQAVSLLDTTVGEMRRALKALNGTLVVQTQESGEYAWKYKHPTVHDAYGALISEEPDLLGIYLAGVPARSLVSEITCGNMRLKGVKLIVPEDQWPTVISRLDEFDVGDSRQKEAIEEFLTDRCQKDFLKMYLDRHPGFISSLSYGSWMRYDSSVMLAARLHACRLLPKEERERFVEEARELAIWTPDGDFLDVPRIRAMFRKSEVASILDDVAQVTGPLLSRWITAMRKECIATNEDPDQHFWNFQRALKTFRREGRTTTDERERRRWRRFTTASHRLHRVVDGLRTRRAKMETKLAVRRDNPSAEAATTRSIFDDVDET